MSKIFISYRRDDTLPTCDHVYERLAAQFGKGTVFRDLNSIALGTDYKAFIQSEIDQAAVELVLIGPQWLNIQGPDGRRRLDDPDDNVRFEVEAALHRRTPIRVIPLLVDGATIPSAESLPPSLRQLNLQNGMPIRNGKDLDHDVDELMTQLRGIVHPDPGKTETPSGANRLKLIRIQLKDYHFGNLEYYKPPMCPVSAGSFLMGRRQGAKDEGPEHAIGLPGFEIAMYPVTVAEYACFVRATGHPVPSGPGIVWEDQERRMVDHPVTYVSWRDAVAYAVWLAQVTGEGWRLPTEAEWEMAACWDRAKNSSHDYPWGNEFDPSRCNTDESARRGTTPVDDYKGKGASPCGALDMAGNVWEWTSSIYKDYPYDARDGRERTNSNELRVRRGGSWSSPAANARTTKRAADSPDHWDSSIGIRLVRGPSVGS